MLTHLHPKHMQLETDIQHNMLCKLASLAVSAGNQDVLDVVAFWMRVRTTLEIFCIFDVSCVITCTSCMHACMISIWISVVCAWPMHTACIECRP